MVAATRSPCAHCLKPLKIDVHKNVPQRLGLFLQHQQRCCLCQGFVFAGQFALWLFVLLFRLAQCIVNRYCSRFASLAELLVPLTQLVLKQAFFTTPSVQRLRFAGNVH